MLVLIQVAGGGREAGGQLEKLGYAPVPEGLDLIEAGEQITHQVLHTLASRPAVASALVLLHQHCINLRRLPVSLVRGDVIRAHLAVKDEDCVSGT